MLTARAARTSRSVHRLLYRLVLALPVAYAAVVSPPRAGAEMDKALISLLDADVELRFGVAAARLQAGKIAEGVRLLQQLQEEIWGRSLLVRSGLEGDGYKVYANAASRIRALLRDNAAVAGEIYRREFDATAHALHERALAENDASELARCHALYPLASVSDLAAVAAAELFVEAGESARAAHVLGDLDFGAAGEAVRARLAIAWLQIAIDRGDESLFDAWSARLALLREAPPPERPPHARRGVRKDGTPARPFQAGRLAWASTGALKREIGTNPYAAEPLFHGEWVAVSMRRKKGEQRVYRFSLATGRLLQDEIITRGFPAPEDNEDYEGAGVGASLERLYAATNGKVLVANYVSWVSEPDQFSMYQIKAAIPRRSLKALRVKDGGEAQALWDTATAGDAWLRELSFNSQPIIIGNRVYALAWLKSGYVDAYLVALDADSGAVVWRTHLAANQIELTMFGEIEREPLLGDLHYEDGWLYACTNIGAIACVAAHSGEVDWLTEYDAIRIRRIHRRMEPQEQRPPWDRNPLLACGDRLIATPLDSRALLIIEKRTGKVLERVMTDAVNAQGSGPYAHPLLAGVHDKDAVLYGARGCLLVPASGAGEPARANEIDFDGAVGTGSGTILARPALVRGGILYPAAKGVYFRSFDATIPDQRVFAYELPKSSPPSTAKSSLREAAGALYVAELGERSFILVVSTSHVACYEEAPPEPPLPEERKPK